MILLVLQKNLPEVVAFRKQQAASETKNMVYRMIKEAIEEDRAAKEIAIDVKDAIAKNNITEQDALVMVRLFAKSLS